MAGPDPASDPLGCPHDRVGPRVKPEGDGDGKMHRHHQNKKYRCAIGSTVAGSQVSSTPSARTS